jgi:hypothetical protein
MSVIFLVDFSIAYFGKCLDGIALELWRFSNEATTVKNIPRHDFTSYFGDFLNAIKYQCWSCLQFELYVISQLLDQIRNANSYKYF